MHEISMSSKLLDRPTFPSGTDQVPIPLRRAPYPAVMLTRFLPKTIGSLRNPQGTRQKAGFNPISHR